MAGLIPQHFIDELLSRIDIVDIIDTYVPLKKAGKNHQACCPFHNEKTPSFTVSQQKQFYHCFGCGANGSAISFLMEYLNMSFVETIEELASRAGMAVPREAAQASRSDNQSSELYELMEMTTSFYTGQIRKHPEAKTVINYLKGRGISGEIAAEYELGFAPPGWDNLLTELGNSDNAAKRLLKIGAVIENDRGGYYDRFRNRLIFPIRDQRGRSIGLGGRVLNDDKPKYLNSPETPVFHKGRELYGLFQARKTLKNIDCLFLVEGYMDVIALAQFGIKNAVASLGTAATPEHMEKMFRITNKVIFCFDGDTAGKKAAWRGMENSLPLLKDDKQVYFMFLPEGEDPDTYIRNKGKDAFLDTKLQIPLSEFLFDSISDNIDLMSAEGQASMAKATLPYISRLTSRASALTSILLRKLGNITKIPVEELTTQLNEYKISGNIDKTIKTQRYAIKKDIGQQSLLTESIKLLLRNPQLALEGSLDRKLTEINIRGIEFLNEIVKYIKTNPNTTIAGITENYRDREKIRKRLIELAPSESRYGDDDFSGEEIRDCFFDAIEKLIAITNQAKLREFANVSSMEELTEEKKEELRALIEKKKNAGKEKTAD